MDRPSSRVAAAFVALLLGVGVGRFVTYDDADATPTASAAGLHGQAVEQLRRAAETGDPSGYDAAERALDEADAVAPGDPGTTLVRGSLALALHRFDEALTYGERAVAENPTSAAAHGVVVDASVELGRYDRAEQALNRMLDLRPDLASLSRVSYLRQLRGDMAGAVEAMAAAEVAGGTPFDVAQVIGFQGDLALARRDLAGAAAAYDRALALRPGIVTARIGRARVLLAMGDRVAGEAELRAVVERVPVPAALVLLGEADLVRATAALQEASGQVVDLEMAVFEADEGNGARAVELARAAFEARPDNVFVADALAWALFRAGDAAAAVPHVESALRLGTVDAALRYHAAEVFAAVGELDRARAELGVAIENTAWTAFRYRVDAEALAARLGMAVPR